MPNADSTSRDKYVAPQTEEKANPMTAPMGMIVTENVRVPFFPRVTSLAVVAVTLPRAGSVREQPVSASRAMTMVTKVGATSRVCLVKS